MSATGVLRRLSKRCWAAWRDAPSTYLSLPSSDAGGEGELAAGDAGVYAGDGASAVVFEGELAFKGVEDGLDPLADSAERSESFLFAFPVGSDQVGTEFVGDESFKLAPGEALVSDDDLARVIRCRSWWSIVSAASRSQILGLARLQTTGIPSGAQIR